MFGAAAEAFKIWAAEQNPWDITVYSDGSKGPGLGYGYAIYAGQKKVEEGRGGMNIHGVVFDAEALGALRGLQTALELYPGEPVTLYADNTGAIWSAQKDASTTSQGVFIAIHGLMKANYITLKWCPGHAGVEGNEMADGLAKLAATYGPEGPETVPTTAGIKSIARREARKAASAW